MTGHRSIFKKAIGDHFNAGNIFVQTTKATTNDIVTNIAFIDFFFYSL
jgi:hypothetical protein